MNLLDALIVLIAVVAGVRGLFRGFIREAFSVLAWVGGLLLAILFATELAPLVADQLDVGRPFDRAIAGVAIFLAVYVGLQLAGWILHRLAHALFLGPVDRVAGLFLGAAKGLVFCSVLLFLAASQRAAPSLGDRIASSPLAATLVDTARRVVADLTPAEDERSTP